MDYCIKPEILQGNFDFSFKAVTYKNFQVALRAFEEFKKQNEVFFSFNKRTTLFGYLLTYSIEKQFFNSAFQPTSTYSVAIKEVNKCKHQVLFISTKDFTLNIGRTQKESSLLHDATYKKELAKGNLEYETQFLLDFPENEAIICPNKKYAVISYRYYLGDLKHLNLLIPDADYKKVLHNESLLKDISVYDNYIPQELVEESIVSLKESLNVKLGEIS